MLKEENPAEKSVDRLARCGWHISNLRAFADLSLVIHDVLGGKRDATIWGDRRRAKRQTIPGGGHWSATHHRLSKRRPFAIASPVSPFCHCQHCFSYFTPITQVDKLFSASLECQSGLREYPVFLPLLPDTSACPQSILGSAQLNLSWPLKSGPSINSKLGLWHIQQILVKPWESIWISSLTTSAHHTVVPETSEAMLRWCFHAGAILRLFFYAKAILRLLFLL